VLSSWQSCSSSEAVSRLCGEMKGGERRFSAPVVGPLHPGFPFSVDPFNRASPSDLLFSYNVFDILKRCQDLSPFVITNSIIRNMHYWSHLSQYSPIQPL
jgi:hypothetical protein